MRPSPSSKPAPQRRSGPTPGSRARSRPHGPATRRRRPGKAAALAALLPLATLVPLVPLATLLSPAALSAQVPLSQDPHIQRALSNMHVTAYDMGLAPGDSTAFHRYLRATVSVVIAGDTVLWQRTDRPADTLLVQPGQATFHAYDDRPVVGRLIDASGQPFRQILVEIGYPSDRQGPGLQGVPGYTQVLDTTRVTLYSFSLAPGQSVPAHTLSRPALLVAVTPGALQATSPDGRLYPVTFQPGDLEWLAAGRQRGLLNNGPTPFQALLVVVK